MRSRWQTSQPTEMARRFSQTPAKPRANSNIASKPEWSGSTSACPATMAMFPFTGWDESFYGDLHIQGKEGVQFYTQQKVVSTRWFGEGVGDVWKK